MDIDRRQFLKWSTLLLLNGTGLTLTGCGGKGFMAGALSQPHVIALVAGHSHLNDIRAVPSPDGNGRGFWQIQTSSLIDFPQQGRIIEILNNGDGTGSIRTFVFNQQVEGQLGKNARASLASAAMQRFDGSGGEKDRDVALMFRMPSWVESVRA